MVLILLRTSFSKIMKMNPKRSLENVTYLGNRRVFYVSHGQSFRTLVF